MSYTLTFDTLEELAAARAVEEHFTTEGWNAIDLYIQRNLPEWEVGEKWSIYTMSLKSSP